MIVVVTADRSFFFFEYAFMEIETMKNKKQSSRVVTDKGEIDLLAMGRLLWNRIWLIMLAGIFLASLAGVITNTLIDPTYESSFTAFVNNKSDAGTQTTVTNADTSAAESLANTYAEILRSRPMLESAAKLAKVDRTYKELNGMVSTSIEANTQLVDVRVTSNSPEEAYHLAKTISEIAPDYLTDIVEGTSMKIVAKPVKNTTKVGPSLMKNCAIGGILGLLLASAIILLLEMMDTRVKSSEELEDSFGYSVVGVIPTFEGYQVDE